MKVAVILCVLGLTLAQEEDPFERFKNRFNWNSGNSWTSTDTGDAKDLQTTDVCRTDQGACGCCLMHQQIDRLKKSFNSSLAELQGQLDRAVNTLNQFRSTRSAFSVSLFTDNSKKCFGPFRDDTLVMYKHIFLNLGDHYNPNTGIFSVPRTGVYSLALTVYSDAGAPGNTLAACASLQVNGRLLTGPREFYMQDQEDSATNSVVVKLTVGDRVSVNLPIGCFLCDNSNHYNTFSGFLLYITD
ncbi:hypothetical protein WMY93_029010 [Mugilogobius chulae]|uniref:C1q domain-containing protein n=1 Tax=Mugilogobius chulae TaxID=88201 RepID=A0AAW0N1U4_9GOBI